MPELIAPTASLHTAFLECRDDWGPGLHEDGFGIEPEADLDSAEGFATWIHRMTRLSHPTGAPCPDQPHATLRWIAEDRRILGGIALRHKYDDDRGYIGYGVRPSARRRGLATWALGEMLAEARTALGIDRALLVCAPDNIASARTIERCGGVFEGIRANRFGFVRRYWVDLTTGG